MDLTKFLFKYAKAPTEQFTFIHLKDIIDIHLEKDPDPKRLKSKSVFGGLSGKNQAEQGFNFMMETTARSYRFQASTKAEQIMWSKAFTVLFELRARVSANLKTTIDINEYLGIRPG